MIHYFFHSFQLISDELSLAVGNRIGAMEPELALMCLYAFDRITV